jgi:hypothetical protein
LRKRDLFGALATMNPAGKTILITGSTDGVAPASSSTSPIAWLMSTLSF